MKILLTGASGTVGIALLSKLTQQSGHQITVFDLDNKNTRRSLKSYKDKIKIIYGDLTRPLEVELACRDVDVVYHLGAIIPPLADVNPSLAYKVNVEGTQNLINGLEKYAPKAFLFYASSISVYGNHIKNPYINIGDPLIPSDKDEYAKTKIAAENLIKSSHLAFSIFRLTAVMGAENHKISPLMFHMPLNTFLEIVTPDDVATAFFNGLYKLAELKGKIFNLGGGAPCRIGYREFLEISFQMHGLGKLDFPEKAFADRNFHCGYYEDGDILENLLHFRNDDLDSYFDEARKSIHPVKRFFTSIFRKWIKKYLLSKSDPYRAYRKKDQPLILHFFNRKHSLKT